VRGAGTGDGGRRSADGDPDAPEVLLTVYDPVEAEIVVAKLRSAGITAYARHDALSVVYGLTVDGFGRQDVLVHSADLEDARAVLVYEEAEEPPAYEDEDRDDSAPSDEREPDAAGDGGRDSPDGRA
jgi:hypothetical protein